MDTFLTIASRRETRDFSDRPLPGEVVERILDAGRLSGSSQNKQPWTFLIVESPDRREALAEAVYEPGNVRGAQLVVAIVMAGKGPTSFDAGRAAQNMMLAAWNDGIGSCPNGISDVDRMRDVVGHAADEQVATVLSFGYPARPRNPERRSADDWIARADRLPLERLVEER
jgi:nitroreductase